MTDGFVKWASDQLDELKIKLTEKYQKDRYEIMGHPINPIVLLAN